MAQVGVRNLREALATYQRENEEVLQWQRKVARQRDLGEAAAVDEALERYNRNCGLLSQVFDSVPAWDVAALRAESAQSKSTMQGLRGMLEETEVQAATVAEVSATDDQESSKDAAWTRTVHTVHLPSSMAEGELQNFVGSLKDLGGKPGWERIS